MCQVETVASGRRFTGNSSSADIEALMRLCRRQTPLEAQAAALGSGDGKDINGFKVREQVQVSTPEGWKEALIVAMNGNDYRVRLPDGKEAVKLYPAEVRRIGPPTERDRALGIFNINERVQVMMDGKVETGRITAIKNMDYEVQLSQTRYVWANGRVLLLVPDTPPGTGGPAGVTPPRPGLTSCAGKIEGVFGPPDEAKGFHIEFRSGRGLMRPPDGHEQTFECWADEAWFYLYRPGEFGGQPMPIGNNKDGTLQTALGMIRRVAHENMWSVGSVFWESIPTIRRSDFRRGRLTSPANRP
jgi:hypothetical protein